jgi:hypothetical protein
MVGATLVTIITVHNITSLRVIGFLRDYILTVHSKAAVETLLHASECRRLLSAILYSEMFLRRLQHPRKEKLKTPEATVRGL